MTRFYSFTNGKINKNKHEKTSIRNKCSKNGQFQLFLQQAASDEFHGVASKSARHGILMALMMTKINSTEY